MTDDRKCDSVYMFCQLGGLRFLFKSDGVPLVPLNGVLEAQHEAVLIYFFRCFQVKIFEYATQV